MFFIRHNNTIIIIFLTKVIVNQPIAFAETLGYYRAMTLEELRTYKPQLQALARKYRIDPDSIRVFGSVARGDAGPDSDVDLLIHPTNGCDIFDISGFHEDINSILSRPTDVISDRNMSATFKDHVDEDCILL